MAQLDTRPTGDREVAGSIPPDWQHSHMKIDHEIFSTVILSLPLIQKGKCQFLAEKKMCTIPLKVNRLED